MKSIHMLVCFEYLYLLLLQNSCLLFFTYFMIDLIACLSKGCRTRPAQSPAG